MTTNFGERSGGFVWFFSFVAAFSERDDQGLILLLDEPGLGLHAAGQADLLRYLDEQLAGGHQVVYTTHSPYMIDANRPHSSAPSRTPRGRAPWSPRRGRPAATPSCPCPGPWPSRCWTGSGPAPHPLVGGVSDLVYLEVMSGYPARSGRRGLDPAWRVLPTGGLAGLPLLATLLGAPLEAAVLLEVGAGHPAVRALAEQGGPAGAAAGPDRADRREPGRPRGPFDDAFYLHLLAATGVEGLDPDWPRSWPARARSSGGSSGPPAWPWTATGRPAISSSSSSGCCRPSAASPCTASPGCSPPWTSCSLALCRPPTRC